MFLGTVSAVALTLYLGRKVGIKAETTFSAALWAVVFGFVGARVSHIIDTWEYYSLYPGKMLAVNEGGLGWYGALIGGTIAVAVYSRISRFSLGRFADAAAPAVFLGLSIGRIGCTLNGDSPGSTTSMPWGVIYTHPDTLGPFGISTHPAPVYEIMWNMVILLVLWWLWRRLSPDGSLFLVALALYAVGRFIVSWFRTEDLVWGALHQSHIISIGILLFAVGMLAIRKTRLATGGPSGETPVAEGQ